MEWRIRADLPIYAQLIFQIKLAIVSGEYLPGERLASVRELAMDAGVNPNTMQRALQELESRGLLQAQRTAGRIVTAENSELTSLRQKRARQLVQDCLTQLRGLGMNEEEIETLLKEVQHADDV